MLHSLHLDTLTMSVIPRCLMCTHVTQPWYVLFGGLTLAHSQDRSVICFVTVFNIDAGL